MEISKKYVIYKLNEVADSNKHLALEEINFKGWQLNSFNTEEEAIQALVKDEKTYRDYLILPQIFITD